jgi:transposase-like protein
MEFVGFGRWSNPMTDHLLKNPIFQDETKARDWLEARVWANGRVCPHCGNADQDKITKLEGKAHRPGVYQCNETECREQFTVTVGTVFESSKIPLSKWLAALFLMTASKKGISAHQVHRMLDISYKSTWFLMHRLREAMRTGGLEPLGGESKIVEADETYFGKAETQRVSPQRLGRPLIHKGKFKNNRPIVALVERGAPKKNTLVAMSPRTRSKATSQCSSAVCAGRTSIAPRNICIAIWRNLISAITTALQLA